MIKTLHKLFRWITLQISYKTNFQSIPRNVKRNYDQRVCEQKKKIAKKKIAKAIPDFVTDKIARNIAYRKVVIKHIQHQLQSYTATQLLATAITVEAAEYYRKEKLILIALEWIIYLFIAAVSTFALGNILASIVPGKWSLIPNTSLKWSIVPGCIIAFLAEIAAMWLFDIGIKQTLNAFNFYRNSDNKRTSTRIRFLLTGVALLIVSASVPIFGIKTTHTYTNIDANETADKNKKIKAEWTRDHEKWEQERNQAMERKRNALDKLPALTASYLAERWPLVDIKERPGCEDNRPSPGFSCPAPRIGIKVTKAFGLLQTQNDIIKRADEKLNEKEPEEPKDEDIPNSRATDNLYLLWLGIVVAKLTRLMGLRVAEA